MKNKIIFIIILIAFCLFTGCKEENKEKEYTFDVIVSSDKLSYGESTNIKVFCNDVEVEITKLETSGDIVTVTDSVISYNKKGKCDIKVYFNYLGKEYTESLSVECLDLVKYEFEIVNESLYKGETQEVVIKSGDIVITDFVLSTFDEGVIKSDGNSICGVYQGKTFVYADFTYQGVNYKLEKNIECVLGSDLEDIKITSPLYIIENEEKELEIELTPKYANCNLIINTSENIWYDKDNNKIIVIDKKIEHGIITITDEYSGFEKTFIVDVIRKEAILFSCGGCGTILKRDSVNDNFKELYDVNIYDEFKKYEMHYFLGGGHSYLYYDNEGDIASSVYGKSLEYRLTELEDRYLDQNHNLYGAQIVLKSIYNYNIYGCSKEDVTYTYEKKILSAVYHVEYETIIYINIGDILSLECVIKNVTNDTHVKKEYIDEVYEYIVDLIGIK